MSLDVYLYESTPFTCECGKAHRVPTKYRVYEANITHSLTAMAEAAGLYKPLWRPDEMGVNRAGDLADTLWDGLQRLEDNPARWMAFNPVNGWGDYYGFKEFVEAYFKACRDNPEAFVEVDR